MHSHNLLFLHTVLSPYFLSLPIISPNPFMDGSVKLLPLCLVLRLGVFKSFFNKFFNIVIALKPLFSFMAKTIWKIKKRRRIFFFFVCLFVCFLFVGPEGPRGFGPFHPKPKAYAEEEEVPGDEWRESKLPECIAEDDPVLDRPNSWEKKAPHPPRTSTRGSQKRFQAIWASHRGIGREAAPRKVVTSVLNTHN